MLKSRILKLAAALTITAGSVAGLGFASAGPAAAAPASRPARAVSSSVALRHPQLKVVQIPVSSLSADLRARVAKGGSPNALINGYEFKNAATANECLDANGAGPAAGKNGDKVQLWGCTGRANQIWIPLNFDENGSHISLLVNDAYQSKCLNARDTGGLKNGSIVQLWDCSVGTANEFWNFGALFFHSTKYLYLSGGTFVLDARSQDLHNGDQIQIWKPLGRTNQFWVI